MNSGNFRNDLDIYSLFLHRSFNFTFSYGFQLLGPAPGKIPDANTLQLLTHVFTNSIKPDNKRYVLYQISQLLETRTANSMRRTLFRVFYCIEHRFLRKKTYTRQRRTHIERAFTEDLFSVQISCSTFS